MVFIYMYPTFLNKLQWLEWIIDRVLYKCCTYYFDVQISNKHSGKMFLSVRGSVTSGGKQVVWRCLGRTYQTYLHQQQTDNDNNNNKEEILLLDILFG